MSAGRFPCSIVTAIESMSSAMSADPATISRVSGQVFKLNTGFPKDQEAYSDHLRFLLH